MLALEEKLTLPSRYLALSVLALLAIVAAFQLRPGGRTWANGIARVSSVLESLERRSPGARTEGKLIKIKHTQRGLALAGPGELLKRAREKGLPAGAIGPVAVAQVFASPAQLLPGEQSPASTEMSLAPDLPPAGGGGGLFWAPPTFAGIPGRGSVGGSGSSGPGAAGGTPGGGDVVSATPTVIVPPVVPELGTWAMMLMGLGLCAHALRRRSVLAS